MKLPVTPSFSLSGRRALVTGGSRGIGLGIVCALAQAGAQVVVSSRSQSDLDEVVAQLQQAGHTASALALDVADTPSAIMAVEAEITTHGAFDILVNNAGIARHGPAIETTLEDFDTVMAINVRGAYFVAQTVIKAMIQAGRGGSVINTSSQMAHVGGIDRTLYSASKHALEGMTKSMAIELGPHNIRVNSIAPTFIKTPLTASTFANPERVAWIQSKIKLPRIGEIEDIMGAVVFLASDAAAMITGTSLLIDGGWTAD